MATFTQTLPSINYYICHSPAPTFSSVPPYFQKTNLGVCLCLYNLLCSVSHKFTVSLQSHIYKSNIKMDRHRFVIEASEAESMVNASGGLTLTQLLPSVVKACQCLARAPISNFPVLAIGIGHSGRILFGVNLEFPGLPLHHTVHAEQFLLTNLCLNQETTLNYLVTSAAPCGHCRQFLQEIRKAEDIQLLITSDKDTKFRPLSEFLIERFGPGNLLDENVPLLLETHHNGLKCCSDEKIGKKGKLKFAALEAANKSHAPYSQCPAGVALMDRDGEIFSGSYTESAAYNPSLGPVQAALVAYIVGGGGGYEEIVAAVLVEKEGAVLVKQEQTARILLQSIAPSCEFQTFYCHASEPQPHAARDFDFQEATRFS